MCGVVKHKLPSFFIILCTLVGFALMKILPSLQIHPNFVEIDLHFCLQIFHNPSAYHVVKIAFTVHPTLLFLLTLSPILNVIYPCIVWRQR